MSKRLEGKVAVVTGGASGMGLASVERLLEEGASVVIADLNEENGKSVLEALQGAGHSERARFLKVDVGVEDDVEAAVGLAVSDFGQLDIMFNNAGVGGAFGSVCDVHVEDWEYTFRVMVTGVFLGIKHAARQMIAQGWGGSIINTGSIAGETGGSSMMCYSAAKAAVGHMSKVAAADLAADQIRVNTILPGLIDTPLLLKPEAEETRQMMAAAVPAGVLGQPSDIAGVVAFYASDDAKYISGDSTLVDGALLAAAPGLMERGILPIAPKGVTGANYGSTGRTATIR